MGQIVCGYDGVDYPSPNDAHLNGSKVMHCGNCGKCSNMHDINIYRKKANTLTKSVTHCAFLSFFGVGRLCMKRSVQFTSPCLDCWMENIACTRKKCLSVCIVPAFLNRQAKSNGTVLNQCLKCDEEMCGPSFKACAGANRRRCAIPTDIDRPEDQLCPFVDLL